MFGLCKLISFSCYSSCMLLCFPLKAWHDSCYRSHIHIMLGCEPRLFYAVFVAVVSHWENVSTWLSVMFIFISLKTPRTQSSFGYLWLNNFPFSFPGGKKICLFTSCRRTHDKSAGDGLVGTIEHSGIVLLRRMGARHLAQRCPQTDLIFSSARVSTFTLTAGWDASILEKLFFLCNSFLRRGFEHRSSMNLLNSLLVMLSDKVGKILILFWRLWCFSFFSRDFAHLPLYSIWYTLLVLAWTFSLFYPSTVIKGWWGKNVTDPGGLAA